MHSIILFACAALLACALPVGAADHEPTLTIGSNQITSTTTFTLRFPGLNMVPPEAVGKPADPAPLVIKPALRGAFVWLDQQGGVFTPSEAPPMSTTFEMSLRDGLTVENGERYRANWRATLDSAPMRLLGGKPLGWYSTNDAPPDPQLTLLFNANIDPAAAAPFCKFVDKMGREVPAQIQQTAKGYHSRHLYAGYGRNARELAPWAEAFRLAQDAAAQPTATPRNQVEVRPAQPLPPGSGWRLIVAAGLPAVDMPVRTMSVAEVAVGDVRPFDIAAAEARNWIFSGRHLNIKFTKPVSKEVTPHNVARWVTVTPEPAGLKATVNGQEIELFGDFDIGTKYTLTVDPMLPCAQPILLARRFTQELFFNRVPPRLYFEEFNTHQLSTGRRKFHLLGVNVPAVRVTAKVFERDSAAQALTAWRKYHRENEENESREESAKFEQSEFYKKVGVDALPGRNVYTRDFVIETALDEQRQITLDWDEILGPGAKGVVLITAEQIDPPTKLALGSEPEVRLAQPSKRPGTQALVQVTDIGVVWKTGRHESFLYAFSMETGRALPGTALELYDEKSKALVHTETDASGVARIPAQPEGRWLLARHGADTHLAPFDDGRDELSFTRYRLGFNGDEYEESFEYGAERIERKALLFTERGVYKPGETVHIKAIMRDYASGRSAIPVGEKLQLVVKDSRNRTLADQTVEVSEFGSVAADVAISGTSLGYYNINLHKPRPAKPAAAADEEAETEGEEDEESVPLASHGFLVQEFVPNAFEIKITDRRVPDSGEIALPIKANYYMGKALSQARVSWTLRAEDERFAPAGAEAFAFCDDISDYRVLRALDRMNEFSEQGQVDIGAEGEAVVQRIVPTNPKAPQPRNARLLCEVTDINQQTVTAEHAFKVHASDFYLGVAQFPEVLRENAPLPLEIIAAGADGEPLAESVETTVRLTRINWQTNRLDAAGESTVYTSEPSFQLAAQTTLRTSLVKKQDRKWQIAQPNTQAHGLTTGQPGQYLLEVMAKDGAGRDVVTATTFYVYGAAQTVWNYRNPFQIDLVADREKYRVGEEAVLLVKTPIAGDALVTVERENVRRSWVTRLEGNAPSITVPIEDADAPNVYVSAVLLRGAADSPRKFKTPEYRVGYAKLSIDRPAGKLSVYVRPSASAYRPGDLVKVEAEVLDYEGKPVPNAEVTLYAVDEGVLSLTGYETPNPFEFFNRERALQVSTGLTLPRLMNEDPEERDFANKGYLIGDKGGPDRVRRNFLACALWSTDTRTGPTGRIAAEFPAPDGLTRYRIMAVVQTAQDQYGTAESAFEINKPVMIEPAPPRFANVGDKLLLRAVVHNTTPHAGMGEVRLELDSTAVAAEEPVRTIPIPANGTVALDFPVEFKQTGEAKWTWSVRFASADGSIAFRDAAQSTLQVHYPTPARHSVKFTSVEGSKTRILDEVPAELLDGFGSVTVNVANSRVNELGDAIRELLHYPYGCVEQTTSSTLPWLTLRSLRSSLPDLNKSDAEIQRAVERGVNRLLSMQTDKGGLSYWPGAKEPMLWGSAYGAIALAMARQQGYTVPEEEMAQLGSYLSDHLRSLAEMNGPGELSERCLALYALALAGRPEAAYHEVLFAKRDRLTREDRALLALAINEAGGAVEMIEQLLDPRLPSPRDGWHWFGSAGRESAMTLLARVRTKPDDGQIDKMIAELLGYRVNGNWYTTQGNAWSLLALSEYVEKVERRAGQVQGSVSWSGEAKEFKLTPQAASAEHRFTLTPQAGASPMEVLNPGRKRLFAQVRIESRSRQISQPRQDQGYSISRSYQQVLDDGKLVPLREARVGDRVLVTLQIAIRNPAQYLAVEDPLPSIFEAINPEFKTQATVAGEQLGQEWVSDYHELREDRALFFCDSVFPGIYTIKYLARVRAAGTATAPSARVEEMYDPARSGQTETMLVTSLPLK